MRLIIVFLVLNLLKRGSFERPIVIGHRGTAYLPELTLSTQSMAHAYGADIIEIDVCLSRDNQLVVIHDIYLDAVTNVRDVFLNRNRSNGLNYVIDFDWNELKTLTVFERRNFINGEQIFPLRFPTHTRVPFHLSSLNETIELLLGLNHATNHRRQLLIEIKKPEYHTNEGRSISKILLDTLTVYNLTRSTDPIILQTFHIEELYFIRNKLATDLRLFALITSNAVNESSSDYDYYQSEIGIRNLSTVVQGLAPSYRLLVDFDSNGQIIGPTSMTKFAHQWKVPLYPYTFRKDEFIGENFQQLVEYFWHTVKIDGFITDHPNIILEYLNANRSSASKDSLHHSILIITITFLRYIFH